MASGQGRWYDVTLSGEYTPEQIIDFCKEHCKKWVFQKEQGNETGYEHYQLKVVFTKPIGLQSVVELFQEAGMFRGHAERSFNLSFDYVTKTDSRIAGPWRWDDKPIPEWLRCETIEWYQWQEKLISETADARTVRVIIDTVGNSGKSFLTNWLAVRKRATMMPLIGNYKDVMRAVQDRPKTGWYIMDMPRAEKLNEHLIAAIEDIKNGHVWDDRYKFEEEWFEPPKVTIFTNKELPLETLSKDRWRICHIRGRDIPDF